MTVSPAPGTRAVYAIEVDVQAADDRDHRAAVATGGWRIGPFFRIRHWTIALVQPPDDRPLGPAPTPPIETAPVRSGVPPQDVRFPAASATARPAHDRVRRPAGDRRHHGHGAGRHGQRLRVDAPRSSHGRERPRDGPWLRPPGPRPAIVTGRERFRRGPRQRSRDCSARSEQGPDPPGRASAPGRRGSLPSSEPAAVGRARARRRPTSRAPSPAGWCRSPSSTPRSPKPRRVPCSKRRRVLREYLPLAARRPGRPRRRDLARRQSRSWPTSTSLRRDVVVVTITAAIIIAIDPVLRLPERARRASAGRPRAHRGQPARPIDRHAEPRRARRVARDRDRARSARTDPARGGADRPRRLPAAERQPRARRRRRRAPAVLATLLAEARRDELADGPLWPGRVPRSSPTPGRRWDLVPHRERFVERWPT